MELCFLEGPFAGGHISSCEELSRKSPGMRKRKKNERKRAQYSYGSWVNETSPAEIIPSYLPLSNIQYPILDMIYCSFLLVPAEMLKSTQLCSVIAIMSVL